MNAPIENYTQTVTTIITTLFGSNLVGIYLHGSSVTEGRDAHESEIDFLVVCETPMTIEQQSLAIEQLSEQNLPSPATDLAISVVLLETCQHPTADAAFEYYISTSEEEPNYGKVINGYKQQNGDYDILLNLASCRQTGRVLGASRPPAEVFAPIDDRVVIQQMVKKLRWAEEHAPDEYAVLNACRAWKFAEDRSFVSKIDGGLWALKCSSGSERRLLQHALDRQNGLTTESLDENVVGIFVMDVRSQIESYLRNLPA